MKIYVAGKWEDREQIREIQQGARNAGHEITCDWTGHEYPAENVEAMLRGYAEADIKGVVDADVIFCLAQKPHNYRGMLVEIGAALALGKRVFVYGDAIDSCIFMHHPCVRKVDAQWDNNQWFWTPLERA